jgi:hypothetical protein
MLVKKLFARKYRDAAGDDGSGEGGSGGVDVQALIAAEVEKAKAALEKEYSGLKKTNESLIAEKRKLQESVKKIDGLDVDALLEMKKNLDQSEEAKLWAEGKGEEVFARRTERMQQDLNSKITALATELETERKKVQTLAETKKRLMIDGSVRDAAVKAGVRPDAMDYVLRLAHDVYDEDAESGEIVPRDRQGNLILGKDATNPQPIHEWMDELRTKAEFVFPSSGGAGTSGNGKGGKGGWTAEAIANLSPTEYMKLRSEGKIK